MGAQQVTLWDWPESQNCEVCIHGEHVNNTDGSDHLCICNENKLEQDDLCPTGQQEYPTVFLIMNYKGKPEAVSLTEDDAKTFIKEANNSETDEYYTYIKLPIV